ncbi:MAG: capsule assembly Wzi family protein [Spirosomataceae bacterium]
MRKNLLFIVCSSFIGFFGLVVQAQEDTASKHTTQSYISINGYGTNNQIPFWLRANQYNTAPKASGGALEIARESKKFIGTQSKWQIGYGANAVFNFTSIKKQLILPELYGKIQYRKWALYAGRKKETFGYADTTLGTGSYSWSGNALPMPKIQLSISEFLPLKFTKNRLAIKGTYAHGWFGSGDYAYGYMLHQKSFYARLGAPKSPIKLYGGFTHNVQWGGKTTDSLTTVENRTLPSSFKDYIYVVTGSGGLLGKGGGTNAFDSTNRVGNHLGTLDVGLVLELKKYEFTLYRQSIFEDGSLYYLNSIKDGLNGFIFRNLFPQREQGRICFEKFVFEFLYTMSQGGPIFGPTNFTRGNDNYFNHQQYYDGWSYQRRVIGSPFMVNRTDTKVNAAYNSYEIANNNRTRVYHLGFQGYIGQNMRFLTKISLSHNYGTYNFPYPDAIKQLSGLVQLSGQINAWKGLEWNATFAIDQGELYENSMGGSIGIRKTWSNKN